MRTSSAAIGLALASLALGGCSGKHEAGATSSAPAGGGGAPSTVSTPRPGLWRMTVSAEGMPTPMVMQACVGAPAPGTNPFAPPPRPGQDCTRNAYARTAAGYSIDMECQANGVTVSTKGDVTGDFSSSYTIAMRTRMGGPRIPAAMGGGHVSKVDATYLGACPAGMAPGTARPVG